MPIKNSIQKMLVWDNETNSMVQRTEVKVWIETNQGTPLFEEGPLYCKSGQEAFIALNMMKERLVKKATNHKESEL